MILTNNRPPSILRNNSYLQEWFEYCQRQGTADDWDQLALAYYFRGYYLNALAYFRKADELRQVNVTLKNPETLE